MIDQPQILTTEALPIAVIHVTVSQREIQNVMRPTLRELVDEVERQQLQAVGAWFTHHRRRPSDTFDFEVGVVLPKPIAPSARVRPSVWPALRVARTIYRGSYEGLGAAWSEFLDRIEADGHTPTADLWERYSIGPETTNNAAEWQTELTQPLLS